MGFTSRIGRLALFIFFVGFAIHQLQYPQASINQTFEKTNLFFKQVGDITQSPAIKVGIETIPAVVFGCSMLKLFVGLGILLKWKNVKLIGSAYLISALFVVYNPINTTQYHDTLLFLGALGAIQFI